MLLCNLPLSYTYLFHKLCLLLWRPCPMRNPSVRSYYIYWEEWLGSPQPAQGLTLGPVECCPGWQEAVGKGQGAEEAPALNPPSFPFQHHLSSIRLHLSPQGWNLCHPYINKRSKDHLHQGHPCFYLFKLEPWGKSRMLLMAFNWSKGTASSLPEAWEQNPFPSGFVSWLTRLGNKRVVKIFVSLQNLTKKC